MRYFRNTELAKLYGISEKTVRNWVKQAQEGKLELDLYNEKNGKTYVADTTRSAVTIRQQVEEGRKYHNSRTHKIIRPKSEFYEIYSDEQRFDIISHLEKFNEFPFHYVHMGKGAEVCAQYYERLQNEPIANIQTTVGVFLKESESYLLSLFEDKLNIIEIGGRTGLTTREFVGSIFKKDRLGKYIDLDISQDMITKNTANLKSWFGDTLDYGAFQKDVIRDRFDDVALGTSLDGSNAKNLILLPSGTLYAFIDPRLALNNIGESMSSDDYFVMTTKLDTETARRYFDFNPSYQSELLPQKELLLAESIGIEKSFYSVEQFYDEKERARKIQIRLKFDVTIEFDLPGGAKSLHFRKGEAILLWRAWHQTMEEIIQEFNECGFNVMQAVKSPDEQYAMIIAKVKTDKVNHR